MSGKGSEGEWARKTAGVNLIFNMGKTWKDKNKHWRTKTRVARNVKMSAREKRKALRLETNPSVLKKQGADEWDWS